MTDNLETRPSRKLRLVDVLKQAASKAVKDVDPWAKYNLHLIPAERVIRHLYNPETKTWSTDETIVKIEKTSFTNGAMRYCYRLKKRATPPASATNHRFHNHGWTHASNYVAKAYQLDKNTIDTSDEAKAAVQNDIMLQYEASHWAEEFNKRDPPKKIVFIRAYALEFPDREGKPWFALERFIDGSDSYGCGFTKHNTNSGFVDEEQHRVTPQVFSAYSFYASNGTRLVADIQGVGDLFTDPQVLSNDYRFGDGDLGPRGMALFFKTFRHNTLADSMGIPVFPLSRNELKCQAKYEDENATCSLSDGSFLQDNSIDLCRFAMLDRNRSRRQSVLDTPLMLKSKIGATVMEGDDEDDSEEDDGPSRRSSNLLLKRDDVAETIRKSIAIPPPAKLNRSTSDIDEIHLCLERAKQDFTFDHTTFRRKESGELAVKTKNKSSKRLSLNPRNISGPILPNDETKQNLGKVHYQLAVLHGMGRFADVVPVDVQRNPLDAPSHDSFSVLFHLSHAAALNHVPALLALGRVQSGLGSCVSDLLPSIVPIDCKASKDLFQRCIDSPYPPAGPKAAAGCLLFQILSDQAMSPRLVLISVLEDTIAHFMTSLEEQEEIREHHAKIAKKGKTQMVFHVGDRVEANYYLEGTFYPAVVESVSADGKEIEVKYDDDGSTEMLTIENVRLIVPPTTSQTELGGPLSDEEALGSENSDSKCIMELYELNAELANLKEQIGEKEVASALYEVAAEGAMNAGKMKTATQWSLKAAELAS